MGFEKSPTENFWLYAYQPSHGHVVADIGAGIGEDASLFSRWVGTRGKVIAVEAHPRTYRRLVERCSTQGLANVTPVHAAIMHRRGEVWIDDLANHESNSVSRRRRAGQLRQPVEGVSLDELLQQLGLEQVDFLKMNIEGADRFALRGSGLDHVRRACIACHDFRAERDALPEMRTRAIVERQLRSRGFVVSSRQSDPRPYVRDHLWAIRCDSKLRDDTCAERSTARA